MVVTTINHSYCSYKSTCVLRRAETIGRLQVSIRPWHRYISWWSDRDRSLQEGGVTLGRCMKWEMMKKWWNSDETVMYDKFTTPCSNEKWWKMKQWIIRGKVEIRPSLTRPGDVDGAQAISAFTTGFTIFNPPGMYSPMYIMYIPLLIMINHH